MMDNKLVYLVEKKYENFKIRDYLKQVHGFSTRLIRGAAFGERLFVNGKTVRLSYRVLEGDKIEVDVNKPESQNVDPEKMDLNIVYEDSDIIVLNKPANMIVHPTKNYQHGTLSNGLLYYFREKGENCIVRLVNRLDMDTSGLVLVAKNQFSHMALARDMKLDTFKKEYIAVVRGNLSSLKGTIDKPIYKEEEEPIRRTIDDRGQESITHFEVVERYKNADKVKLVLETGRTHQIRVHLSSIGNPIIGDSLYGEESELIKRQALHAFKLQFPHPRDGRIVNIEVKLPEDIENLISKVKGE
ncbi:23S rRNA pseudouridine1911/1915/1917 synthase [Clostridium acetobutylicum]|uniref:Pseudouridine synthase n=1 Tax=Clostridium acetobutylicum (strain ATCC 824 / DSM 792 / JCM 1419 / IAM 19013 / LMG 5710 / NBRC 13948 / NRRL B-527 / VKM B-1787 / 2291 / W) TaxID=272562 RepID=Q97JK8_CLOAB|nr:MULTISPECIES: RluA family pseudouridine synthase [Clostridium]AAK79237.1 Pseudouridylate synthase family protein, yabo B.subtilis ortholog [Clostridium acetobutylicum ATCC 824]ADZ20317.1 Pseudouridylate synthase family protein [Clostridium acetobutylicum EA 2018]AEI33299.1 pseudouridylate synthase [Clostridium acetobutylicum DSM 1731]AWV81513.1 RluA family pseudouridine synthase [Clostridium acetobutylicum]KHD35139.1 pseudouridylate synthase [Clostridium acetobutylicum]